MPVFLRSLAVLRTCLCDERPALESPLCATGCTGDPRARTCSGFGHWMLATVSRGAGTGRSRGREKESPLRGKGKRSLEMRKAIAVVMMIGLVIRHYLPGSMAAVFMFAAHRSLYYNIGQSTETASLRIGITACQRSNLSTSTFPTKRSITSARARQPEHRIDDLRSADSHPGRNNRIEF